MNIIDVVQNSPEWFAARAGHVTSSRIDDVLAIGPKGGESEGRKKYKWQLVAEILAGQSFEKSFQSPAMKEGKNREAFGREAYSVANEVLVREVGFVQHPTIERAGCSPDGLVGNDGLIEIKAPDVVTHLQYRAKNRIPPEYAKQCIWHLACTRREWVDFVSFSPELPAHLQLFVMRMEAEPGVIEMFESKVKQFLAEVNGLLVEHEATELVR